MSLWSDFLSHDQRMAHKWAHFFPAYERHFARFVNTDVVFIEIGIASGGSLQLWKKFFGPFARIVGHDINPKCAAYGEEQIHPRIGDQTDLVFLQGLIDEFGAPDIVLDDGSHQMNHIHATFEFLYPRLAKNGVYMVEDLHCSYWENYGGGLNRPGTFIETSKRLIDELNADTTRGAVTPTDFTRNTISMHFYDSIVVFEKGRTGNKIAYMIPPPPPPVPPASGNR